jgi:hypothetical protein
MDDNAERAEPSGAEKMFGEFAPALVAFRRPSRLVTGASAMGAVRQWSCGT